MPRRDRSLLFPPGTNNAAWRRRDCCPRDDPATNTVYLAPGVAPNQSPDNPNVNSVPAEVRYLLGRPDVADVVVNSHAVLDGKQAIELTFFHGRFSYWLSPHSYRPRQSGTARTRCPRARAAWGSTAVRSCACPPGSPVSPSLLSLEAQHPGATVDHSSNRLGRPCGG
jgi:hypothetical protein